MVCAHFGAKMFLAFLCYFRLKISDLFFSICAISQKKFQRCTYESSVIEADDSCNWLNCFMFVTFVIKVCILWNRDVATIQLEIHASWEPTNDYYTMFIVVDYIKSLRLNRHDQHIDKKPISFALHAFASVSATICSPVLCAMCAQPNTLPTKYSAPYWT